MTSALEFRRRKPPVVLVTMREWNRLTDKALRLAMELSPDVTAVHLAPLEGRDVERGGAGAAQAMGRARRKAGASREVSKSAAAGFSQRSVSAHSCAAACN